MHILKKFVIGKWNNKYFYDIHIINTNRIDW